MTVLSRLGVTFKVGVLALAAGALIASCGSITVIDPDGGPGSGGASGGGSGGGKGDSGVGDGGAIGGSNGGGTGGRLGGSGGTTGTGGVIGGSGGRPIGSGGTIGIGGTTGTGGNSACSDIKQNFAIALAEARTCTPSSGCPYLTNDQIDCGCPTSVSHSDRVEGYRQAWFQNGCSSGACPAIFCVLVTGGSCGATGAGSTGMCVNSSAGTP